VVSDRLLRTRDVAAMLGVSSETVLRWHRSGNLHGGYRLASNVLRFREAEIEA
jgi:predicted DNA-binding transcriptional regulator AlpA